MWPAAVHMHTRGPKTTIAVALAMLVLPPSSSHKQRNFFSALHHIPLWYSSATKTGGLLLSSRLSKMVCFGRG